jgi:hypothetical protein
MKLLKKSAFAVLLGLFVLGWNTAVRAESLEGSLKRSLTLDNFKKISADNWNIVGSNLMVKGNVHVPLGEFDIYADQAMVDMESRSFSVKGNIQVYRRASSNLELTPKQLIELEGSPGAAVEILGIATNIFGEQKISVKASYINGKIKADTFSGNLQTGYFEFTKAELDFNSFVCRADSGERKSNGVITIRNAEVSACSYLESNNAHYSFSCREATITPYDTGAFGMDRLNSDTGDYSLFATNCVGKIYGIPVIWMPMVYKPKDENLGIPQIQIGKNTDWGFYVSVSKKYQITDYPYSSVRLLGDYYQFRGFGYGAQADVGTENSTTSIFGYSIYDQRPYKTDDYEKYGVEVPHARYDFRISNVTHIEPTLDFRGHFEIMSDPYINRDFFDYYYNQNPEPVTFAALEKQFEHFSASIYVRPQVNDFFNTVENLPSGRIDVQRQELFDTNLYYQGEVSMGYLQRRWSQYDTDDVTTPSNYRSGRFDNLNFFYYPFKLDWLNVIPRAGFRMTAYTDSSKKKISNTALNQMLMSNDVGYEAMGITDVESYDDKGGSRFRFAGEFGTELNTKIYNSWQDVRSSFLGLDGLRHLFEPYINYTFIPEPTEDRAHLYYFDDIDRINEQNFVRLGMVNRLQTRSGDQTIIDYLTMENYWDYHFNESDGFNHIGDFCSKLSTSPIKGLTLSTMASIAVGGNDSIPGESSDIIRNGRNVGHPGLYAEWLNRWEFNIKYEPVKDYIFTFKYNYQNPYQTFPAYSMGSTLSDTDSGSAFETFHTSQIQQLVFGFSFPITPDRRTRGAYKIAYDFNAGFAPNQSFSVIRSFHCWELAAEVVIYTSNDATDGKERDIAFMVTAYLTGLTSPLQQTQSYLMNQARTQLIENKDQEGGFF